MKSNPAKVNPQVIESLACPSCQGALVWLNTKQQNLYCRHCKVSYPLRPSRNHQYLVAALMVDDGVSTIANLDQKNTDHPDGL